MCTFIARFFRKHSTLFFVVDVCCQLCFYTRQKNTFVFLSTCVRARHWNTQFIFSYPRLIVFDISYKFQSLKSNNFTTQFLIYFLRNWNNTKSVTFSSKKRQIHKGCDENVTKFLSVVPTVLGKFWGGVFLDFWAFKYTGGSRVKMDVVTICHAKVFPQLVAMILSETSVIQSQLIAFDGLESISN